MKAPSSSSCFLHAVLSFLLGSLSAWLSQAALQLMNAHLDWSFLHLTSSWSILCFSFFWSMCTCVILFLGLSMHFSLSRCLLKQDEEMSSSVRMELAFLFGALLTVTELWMTQDVTALDASTEVESRSSPFLWVVVTASTTWVVLVAIVFFSRALCCRSNPKPTESLPLLDATSSSRASHPPMKECCVYLSASVVGLLVGIGSQLILSLFLWNNSNQIPLLIRSNWRIALFSFGWSFLTVIATWLACFILRALIHSCDALEERSTLAPRHELMVRMEAVYIGWTLTGICIGWIVLDILHNMLSQIFISLGLFVLSLTSFIAILYCFPDTDNKEESASDLSEPLLLHNDDEMNTLVVY
jgi:hypothetical protein